MSELPARLPLRYALGALVLVAGGVVLAHVRRWDRALKDIDERTSE